jgi:uncharacterized protein (TIGR03067 family)
MTLRLPLILVVAVLLGAQERDKSPVSDQDRLQGDWQMVASERDGNKVSEDEVRLIQRTVKDNEITVKRAGMQVLKATFILDVTQNPRHIDINITNDAGSSAALKGIYQLDGDRQKVCYAIPGIDRPKDFTVTGKGYVTAVWQKKK